MNQVILKGNENGYELKINETCDIKVIIDEISNLLDDLSSDKKIKKNKSIMFELNTGNRLLKDNEKDFILSLFKQYDFFEVKSIISNVITKEEALKIKNEGRTFKTVQTIRNGQYEKIDGDVLVFGKIHKGGKLVSTGNVYVLGDIEGIIHAGFPNYEDKLIIGKIDSAQQVRIGEQHQILSESNFLNDNSSQSVVYVNDLHILDNGNLNALKSINPKFFNEIGGTR
ncbi:cell division inhibitor [Lactobacillus sp. S2-2]|uniref:septum site-determining protein MinC n=1 Tax=Lactobacillus sp. S2-2 TaxID=2692917 RepID=UPI001F35DD86|nr:septum site-determining protein MinC [Lactobacillus sp. S2-2]MCF6515793.1 cell division inhibitor [Lactobacillus sp. S2-2]